MKHPHTYPIGSTVYVLNDADGFEIPPFKLGKVTAYGWCDSTRTEPAYMVAGTPVAEFQLGTLEDVRNIG